MARRLLERGVRFVQVTHSDSEVQWDQHSDLYQGHTKTQRRWYKQSQDYCKI